MVGKYFSTDEKSRALALGEEHVMQKEIARRIGSSLTAIKDMLRRTRYLPFGTVPPHKNIPGLQATLKEGNIKSIDNIVRT